MKRMIKALICLALCLSCNMMICLGADIEPSVSSVELNIHESTTVTIKGISTPKKVSITSDAKLKKKKKTNKYIYYATKNPGMASITASQNTVTITGWKTGRTTVKAKYNGKTYSIAVTIANQNEPLSYEPADVTLPDSIPSYWNDEISDSLGKVKARKGDATATFLYLTDSHWGSQFEKVEGSETDIDYHTAITGHSPSIIQYLSEQLSTPFALCGGDVIESYQNTSAKAREEITAYYDAFGDVKVLSTMGNHDMNDYKKNKKKSSFLKKSDIYNLMMSRSSSFATVNKKLYAYADDEAHKVRVISFCYDATHTKYYTSSISKWIGKRVKELDKDWTVILISHAYWNDARAGKTTIVSSKSASIQKNFLKLQSQSKATIAAWFVGHTHRDRIITKTGVSGTSRLNIVSTIADSFVKTNRQKNIVMTPGTDTEQAMDIIQIDTDKRVIYLTRVGAGEDRVIYY